MDYSAFPLELKALSEAGVIEGLAAGYGNLDAGGDIVAPGAFADSLAAHKAAGTMPGMLLHHDPRRPVGRWESFSDSAAGLVAKGKLTLAATDAKEAYALLKDGAMTGLSIGYRAEKVGRGKAAGSRLIEKASLVEVSLVTFPMNPLTRVSGVKSVASISDLEAMLREGGVPHRKAALAAKAAWIAIDSKSDDDAAERRAAAILTAAIAAISSKG